MKGVPIGPIGCVLNKKDFRVYGLDNKKVIDVSIDKLKDAWQRPLRW